MLELWWEKASAQPVTMHLQEKGVYTAQARMLARTLVRFGCAQERVGDVLLLFGRMFGVSLEGKMSGHTVRRAR